jgi:membrane protein implicated in regulation of membrane protease activity
MDSMATRHPRLRALFLGVLPGLAIGWFFFIEVARWLGPSWQWVTRLVLLLLLVWLLRRMGRSRGDPTQRDP